MTTFHPAAKPATVELRASGAVDVQILRNSFLPARDRHDDLNVDPGASCA